MLSLILLSLILSIVVIVIFSSIKKMILPVLLHLIVIVYIVLFAMYFAKTGGLTIRENSTLLGPVWLVSYFQSYPISADLMASIMTALRIAFCIAFFFYSISCNYTMRVFFLEHKVFYCIVLIPLLLILVMMQPHVFSRLYSLDYHKQRIIVNLSDILILLTFFFSFLFYFIEYKDIGIPVMRARHRNLMLSAFLLSVVFLFFASLNPVTVFQDYSTVRVYSSSIIPIQGYNAYSKWWLVLSSCLVLLVTIIIQNLKYYRYTYNRSRNELLISRRQNDFGGSSSVLVHGLKNQIIVAEILVAQLSEQMAGRKEEMAAEYDEIRQLSDQIEVIRNRLDVIYKSFMKVELKLVRLSILDLMATCRAKLPADADSFIGYEIEDSVIIADKELLSEAIYNVINNAIEATKGKKEPKVEVKVEALRARVMISIRNNGPEIPPKIRQRLFQPFTTTKNTGNNWGLGLFYTHMIIKMHFGDIQLESNPQWTEFLIMLPKNRVR